MLRSDPFVLDPFVLPLTLCAPILIINDVTLYLQAGDDGLLEAALKSADTLLVNAYYGTSFADHPISQRERRLTDRLMAACDQIIWMPEGHTAD